MNEMEWALETFFKVSMGLVRGSDPLSVMQGDAAPDYLEDSLA